MKRKRGRQRLARRRGYQTIDVETERGIMSIKGQVVDHLLAHRGEVVSLTTLASSLDVKLDTVRSVISVLRSSKQKGGGGMRDDIVIVSQGYAVKYVGPARETQPEPVNVPVVPKPAPPLIPPVSAAPTPASVTSSDVDKSMTIPVGVEHPYSDDVETVLGQLGPVAHKVFAFIASQNGQNVTGDDVIEATGLKRSAVSSAFYNTLFNVKQLNRNARRLFVKVGKDVYRMSLPGDGVAVGASVKHSQFPAELPTVPTGDPIVAKTATKLYGNKETKLSTQKRIFEELRVLPDGAVLIEDEDGRVYKAREV